MGQTYVRKPRARSRLVFDRFTAILLAVFIILAIITAGLAFRFVRDTVKSWTMTPLEGISISAEKTPKPGTTAAAQTQQAPLDITGPVAVPWDKTRPVYILVMGLDYSEERVDQDFGPAHTDSMMLLSYDPVSNSGAMLSIPRDLWVNIPGYDYGKINTAYTLGETYQLPGGGPGLAVETVESFLGIPINYYAQIDFAAFVRFVDEIGGVKLDIPEDIKVDPIGPENKVLLKAGRVTLPGDLALAYARARYTEGGDFDRGARQRQVIMSVFDRLVQFNMLPNLISKAPVLYGELSSGVRTNMSLNEIISLGAAVLSMPRENIRSAGIGPNEVEMATAFDGQSILIPYPDQIRLLRDQTFTAGGPLSPASMQGDVKALSAEEGATISVQNGSYATGIASNTANWFREQGLNVTEETNADGVYATTTIIIYDQTPNTAAYIWQLMQIDNAVIINSYQPDAAVDIAVILGTDWATSNPMP